MNREDYVAALERHRKYMGLPPEITAPVDHALSLTRHWLKESHRAAARSEDLGEAWEALSARWRALAETYQDAVCDRPEARPTVH